MSPNAATAFTCPSSDATLNSVASAGAGVGTDSVRRAPRLRVNRAIENASTGLLAVTYSTSAASGSGATTLATREHASGATVVNQMSFDRLGKVIHVVSVPVAQMNTVAATLRSQAGVESVAPTGFRRYPTTVTPLWPNDPYFNGFNAAQILVTGTACTGYIPSGAVRAKAVPSQANGTCTRSASSTHSGTVKRQTEAPFTMPVRSVRPASRSRSSTPVKIRRIPNFSPRSRIKNALSPTQMVRHNRRVISSRSARTWDRCRRDRGRGAMNNGLGFVGAGGNVVIYAYRVFPTPDDSCCERK